MAVNVRGPSQPSQPAQAPQEPAGPSGPARPAQDGASPGKGGPASASTPGGGAQPSPARSGAPGALGLGLDVGVLSGPQSVAVEAPRDGFDRGPSDVGDRPSAPTHQPTDDAGLRRAHNPFQALARSARPAPARAFAVRPVPISEPVDLPLDTLARLAGLERAAGPEHTGRFNKIRQGNLLLTTDSQGVRAARAPVGTDGLARVVAAINKAHDKAAAHEAFRAFTLAQSKALASTQMDIQSYVQRVLRESYLVQSDVLYDIAEKVKFANEQKRRLREKLQAARASLANWRGESKPGEPYVAPKGVLAEDLGDDGVWRPRMASQEDVDAWHAAVAQSTARSDGYANAKDSFAGFMSEQSLLTFEEKALLDAARARPNADWIHQYGGAVATAIAKMNQEEFDQYVLGADGGTTVLAGLSTVDMEGVTGALLTLTPAQALYMVARQIPNDPTEVAQINLFGMKGHDAAMVTGVSAGVFVGGLAAAMAQGAAGGSVLGPIGSAFGALFGLVGGLFGLAGGAVGGWIGSELMANAYGGINGLDDEQQQLVLDHYERMYRMAAEELGVEFDGTVDRGQALRLLGEMNAQVQPGARSVFGDPPIVGEPLHFTMPDQLDAYIEGLEERLNQEGDDAQLMNVDLQNALQAQQQTLQMLSNIAKMLHDTAMASVRKLSS